jgi:hydrogenase maturation protease
MTKSKTLILGLGNPMMSDDGIGLMLVEKLAEQIKEQHFDFKTSEKVGLNLIELLNGYERAIIIDSIITGKHTPGEIIEFSLDELPDNPRLRCPHDVDFKSAVELARKTGLPMPKQVFIFGIEIIDNLTFSPDLSPEIYSLVPSLLKSLTAKIQKLNP